MKFSISSSRMNISQAEVDGELNEIYIDTQTFNETE